MNPLKNYILPTQESRGFFGHVRTFDIHTGMDLYTDVGEEVNLIEDGTVINIFWFTGKNADSPWWEDTMGTTVEGKSGVILYGEIFIESDKFRVGQKLKEGTVIGTVMRVIKNPPTNYSKPSSMLHLELYEHGYEGSGEWWQHGEYKPEMLKDPTFLLDI